MSRLALFCLPYAGGSARIFESWTGLLPEAVDVVPLELPGRGLRFRDDPIDQLEPLVNDLSATILKTTDGPFAILGYSYGSLLAFEVARRLEHLHGRVARHLLVAAMRGPRWPGPPIRVADLSDEKFRKRLSQLNGTPAELLDNPQFMDLMIPVLRADFAVADSYLWRAGPGVSCPVTAFGGTDDPGVSRDALKSWRQASTGPFDMHMLPGDHFFLQPSRDALLAQVVSSLGGGSGAQRTETSITSPAHHVEPEDAR